MEVRLAWRATPERARPLLTVRAAISSLVRPVRTQGTGPATLWHAEAQNVSPCRSMMVAVPSKSTVQP